MPETRILIVDDNADNIALMEAILRSHGFATTAAETGTAALAQVAAAPPALILLDVMLPDVDGYEVARRIKGDPALPFIPIILVTARHELQDKVYGLEQGADDFLSKPVNRAELLARVRALLRLKSALDEERRQAEALAAANEQLHTSEQQHQELVQMLTHDLRGPITALQASLELMHDGSLGSLSERQMMFVGVGLQNCKLLGRMVSDLLDVYRMEAGHFELDRKLVDLGWIAKTVCEQMQSAVIERGLALTNCIPAGLAALPVDVDRMRRVLINLVNNAVKYTDQGGISLTATLNGAVPPAPPGGAPLAAPYVLVSVEDTGWGIPPESREHIFDKFYRVQRGQGPGRRPVGTGLGLTFCKQTVEAHGGRIWVEPGPGGSGSRFSFTLPLLARAGDTNTSV